MIFVPQQHLARSVSWTVSRTRSVSECFRSRTRSRLAFWYGSKSQPPHEVGFPYTFGCSISRTEAQVLGAVAEGLRA